MLRPGDEVSPSDGKGAGVNGSGFCGYERGEYERNCGKSWVSEDLNPIVEDTLELHVIDDSADRLFQQTTYLRTPSTSDHRCSGETNRSSKTMK